MRKSIFLFALVASATVLSGCESARKAFGKKSGPDEFVVYSRPPLSLPPDYGLRPPKPGQKRLNQVQPSKTAEAAILGKQAPRQTASQKDSTPSSPGLQALMRGTGADRAKADIRRVVNEETSVFAEEDRRFIDKLIFWVDDAPHPGVVVDAKKEQKRILANQALGKPINEGDTPQVRRKPDRKGLLNF